ncbi:hypothetical protein ANCCAN_22800 [Ancylostoma caninum]|uniref:Uncharacterized protein n=1 Tax=Ancylostoma caninum TaxID=29170 RepID=A0A368FIQ0_ANCCA|nr:hypothetical protein ANCCAN_22800 [Ancylostoma caninum]
MSAEPLNTYHSCAFQFFIIAPILLTSVLGCGFLWIEELTVLDARKLDYCFNHHKKAYSRLYTPTGAPSWEEEKIMNEMFQLWPLKPHEFLPERTFEWHRYLYLVVHGRPTDNETYPNLLEGSYLREIERLEADVANNVTFPMKERWRSNDTSVMNDTVTFQVDASNSPNEGLLFQKIVISRTFA